MVHWILIACRCMQKLTDYDTIKLKRARDYPLKCKQGKRCKMSTSQATEIGLKNRSLESGTWGGFATFEDYSRDKTSSSGERAVVLSSSEDRIYDRSHGVRVYNSQSINLTDIADMVRSLGATTIVSHKFPAPATQTSRKRLRLRLRFTSLGVETWSCQSARTAR